MKKIILILLVAIISPVFSSYAWEPLIAQEVQLSITATPSIQDMVNSYIKRELREIKDVVIVESSPLWVLSVVCFEIHNKAGNKTGYVLSAVILFITENTGKGERIGLLQDHKLYVDTDLKQMTTELVAAFDGRCLEKMRHGI